MSDQRNHEAADTPGEASVEEGHVILDGPDGVALTLTPAAALKTAENLRAAAEKALAGSGDH